MPVRACPSCNSMVAISKSLCKRGHLFKRTKPVYNTRSKKNTSVINYEIDTKVTRRQAQQMQEHSQLDTTAVQYVTPRAEINGH